MNDNSNTAKGCLLWSLTALVIVIISLVLFSYYSAYVLFMDIEPIYNEFFEQLKQLLL